MKTKDITSVTMERLVGQYKMPHISHDVVLVDTLKTLPELTGARRLSLCMFMGVCTDGVASITVNGRKRIASRNNVMLITDESVVDNINFSPDFDGIGFFLSYKMLQEILKDIQNMSGLFLLTHNYSIFEIPVKVETDASENITGVKSNLDMESASLKGGEKEQIKLQVLYTTF